MEGAPQTGQERRQKDIGDKGHDRYVHVWAVDVVPRWKEIGRRVLDTIGAESLFARPWPVPPGKEDKEEFMDNVGVGDVEVVFEFRDIDVSIELGSLSAHR